MQKFGHSFGFKIAKYTASGALVGVGSAIISELLETKGKIINKWYAQMKLQKLLTDNLDYESEICKIFYLLHMQYVKNNAECRIYYNQALEKTTDLCFWSNQIEKGNLKDFLVEIKNNHFDPTEKISNDCFKSIFDITDLIKKIQKVVAQSEMSLVQTRNQKQEIYHQEKENYENLIDDYEEKKLELENKLRETNELKVRDKIKIAIEELKAPVTPIVPKGLEIQYKSDMIEKYKDLLQSRLQKIWNFIDVSIKRFRKENKIKITKSNRVEIEEVYTDESDDEEVEEQNNEVESGESDDDD